jgi:hypothetical protein
MLILEDCGPLMGDSPSIKELVGYLKSESFRVCEPINVLVE